MLIVGSAPPGWRHVFLRCAFNPQDHNVICKRWIQSYSLHPQRGEKHGITFTVSSHAHHSLSHLILVRIIVVTSEAAKLSNGFQFQLATTHTRILWSFHQPSLSVLPSTDMHSKRDATKIVFLFVSSFGSARKQGLFLWREKKACFASFRNPYRHFPTVSEDFWEQISSWFS